MTRRCGSHCGNDVQVGHVAGAVAAFATFDDHHFDERYHGIAYFAHFPSQFELLEQAHVPVPLERRVFVTEREQLRYAQRVIIAE